MDPSTECGPAETPEVESQPRRVLLVDDHIDALEIQRMVLEDAGHEVHTATDGVTALSLAREVVPSIVFCDIGLPEGLSGYDVARGLREMDGLDDVTAVAVTGYGRAADRARALNAGFDEHLTKPVSKDDLLACVARAGVGDDGDDR